MYTLGPKIGIIYILGAPGLGSPDYPWFLETPTSLDQPGEPSRIRGAPKGDTMPAVMGLSGLEAQKTTYNHPDVDKLWTMSGVSK